jgi:cytidylate kinase
MDKKSKRIIVAIDGHSSCGKGTLAREVARELGYLFIDSGAMYRAVTLYLLQNGLSVEDVESNPDLLEDIQISFDLNQEGTFFHTHLNGLNVETLIRTMEISKLVSPVSNTLAVREFLVRKQRELGANKGVVMDGRDIGTVVFPDAELKIFMTALPEVRAHRRYLELLGNGMEVDYDEILTNILDRDKMDSSRENSPLYQAKDAITLDNTQMSREDQARIALTWAKGVIAIS